MALDVKRCSDCGLTKSRSEFHNNKRRVDGKQNICKMCIGARHKVIRARDPELHAEQAKRRGINRWARQFGMLPEEIESALKGACAICGDTSGRLCIDHDHSTGEFRGILCHTCNSGIGFLNDDPALIDRAVAYLRGGELNE